MNTKSIVNSIKKSIYNSHGEEIGYKFNLSDIAQAVKISEDAKFISKQTSKEEAKLVNEIADLKINLQSLKSECMEIERKGRQLQADFDLEAKKIAKNYGIDKFITATNFDKKKFSKFVQSLKKTDIAKFVKETSDVFNNKYLPQVNSIAGKYKLSKKEIAILESYNQRAKEINQKCLFAQTQFKDIDFQN
jgi:hypothetical protein